MHHYFSMCLHSLYHWVHGTAVQPELHRVHWQALSHHLLPVLGVMQEPAVSDGQLNPSGRQWGTGHEEGLYSPLVWGRSGPALRERTETSPVPSCPVARQGLKPIPAWQQPRLGDSLLHLPRWGPTWQEQQGAPSQGHESCPEVALGGQGFSLWLEFSMQVLKKRQKMSRYSERVMLGCYPHHSVCKTGWTKRKIFGGAGRILIRLARLESDPLASMMQAWTMNMSVHELYNVHWPHLIQILVEAKHICVGTYIHFIIPRPNDRK